MRHSRRRISHIIWDWNGTLFNDSIALINSTIEAFRVAGLPTITRTDYQRNHTQPIPVFYDRLAGRSLTDAEQQTLDTNFRRAYVRARDDLNLTVDTVEALLAWREHGGTQSVLSMHPRDIVTSLIHKFGIADFFTAVDGLIGSQTARKAPHLAQHLRKLRVAADRVLMVGDSVDDVLAAQEYGVGIVIYHAGPEALHVSDHFDGFNVRIVKSLREAVDYAAASGAA